MNWSDRVWLDLWEVEVSLGDVIETLSSRFAEVTDAGLRELMMVVLEGASEIRDAVVKLNVMVNNVVAMTLGNSEGRVGVVEGEKED